jgi:hypothetical protein
LPRTSLVRGKLFYAARLMFEHEAVSLSQTPFSLPCNARRQFLAPVRQRPVLFCPDQRQQKANNAKRENRCSTKRIGKSVEPGTAILFIEAVFHTGAVPLDLAQSPAVHVDVKILVHDGCSFQAEGTSSFMHHI